MGNAPAHRVYLSQGLAYACKVHREISIRSSTCRLQHYDLFTMPCKEIT